MAEIVREILTNTYENADKLAEIYSSYLNDCGDTNETVNTSRLKEIERDLKKLNSKKDKLLELSLDGSIQNAEFKRRNKIFNDEIKTLEKEKNTLLAQEMSFLSSFIP